MESRSANLLGVFEIKLVECFSSSPSTRDWKRPPFRRKPPFSSCEVCPPLQPTLSFSRTTPCSFSLLDATSGCRCAQLPRTTITRSTPSSWLSPTTPRTAWPKGEWMACSWKFLTTQCCFQLENHPPPAKQHLGSPLLFVHCVRTLRFSIPSRAYPMFGVLRSLRVCGTNERRSDWSWHVGEMKPTAHTRILWSVIIMMWSVIITTRRCLEGTPPRP